MCTRSREARLRDEPSKVENSGAGKRPRHERQRGQHRQERQTERIKRLWVQVKSVIERGKWTTVQSGKKKRPKN